MRNLIGHLMQQPPGTLRTIAANWQVELRRPTHGDNVRMLAEEILDERSIRYLLEVLGDNEIRILGSLIAQENNSLTLEQLEESLSLLPSELDACIQRLLGHGIAYLEGNDEDTQGLTLAIPREVGRALRLAFRELQSPTGPQTARELMRAIPTGKLEAVAAIWGAKAAPGPYYQEELVEAVAEEMQKPSTIETVVSKLDKGAQAIFHLLVESGGSLELPAVRSRLEMKESVLRFHLRELARRLLVMEHYRSNQRVLYIPEEIRDALCQRKAQATEIQEVSELVVSPTLSPHAIAWDLLTYLSLIYQQPSALLLQTRTLRALAGKLWLGGTPQLSEEYLGFLISMGRALNLFTEDDRQVTVGPRLPAWLQMGFHGQVQELLRLWVNERKWLEPVFRTAPSSWGIDVTLGRRRLLEWLQRIPKGRWVSLGSFLATLRRADPYILRPRREVVRLRGQESLEQFLAEWDEVEGRIVTGILSTSLQWLGIVRMGETPSGTKALQVTEVGHAILTGQPAEDHIPQPKLVVQPNFEVTILGAEAAMIWQLLKFTYPARYDQAALYSITKESVLRGLELGMSVEEMLGVLRQYSARDIPQNVAYSMADWARLFKPARLERVVLLETEDPDTLDAILASKILCRYPIRRIASNLAAIQLQGSNGGKDHTLEHLVRRLRREGFFASLR